MTGRTTRQSLDPVLLHQFVAEDLLWYRWLPPHRRDLREGAELALRAPMAVEAPPHLQLGDLVDIVHLIDSAMTALTADSLVHMDRVVEEDEARELMHPHPGDRGIGQITRPDRL